MRIPTRGEFIAVVEAAGKLINKNFGRPLLFDHKNDGTPVTDIDMALNSYFLRFAEQCGISFLGEEGNGLTTGDWILYVDPLDGTGAFIRGMATSTIAASIMFMGEPILSVIHNPMTGQTWSSEENILCQYSRNGSAEALVHVDSHAQAPYRVALCAWPGVDQPFTALQELVRENPDFLDQPMGAFALGGCLIASGTLHATAISATSAVETAAMSLIVKGAGGVVVDLYGNQIEQFELGEYKGKADFLLPYGAILACDMQVAEKLVALYARS